MKLKFIKKDLNNLVLDMRIDQHILLDPIKQI